MERLCARHDDRVQRRIEPPLPQGRYLVEGAVREHGGKPRVDALTERRTVQGEIEARPFSRRQRWRCSRAEERGERTTGGAKHLKRAQDTLPVAGLEPRGGSGVARRELVVKLGRRTSLRLHSDFSPHGFRHGRDVRQALSQRTEIKPGAAHENNCAFADLR